MPLRRLLPFLLINVVVSTVVVLLILYWWDSRETETPDVSPTAQVASLETPGSVVEGFTTAQPAAEGEETSEDNPEDGGEEGEEAEDEDGPTVHTVQAGETLGIISQLYDVPMEDIATANDIVNVNALAIGQQLVIPIGGLPTATPPPTATATSTRTATAEATESAEEVEDETGVVEVTEVVGVGDLTAEAVRISNAGTSPVMLRDWQLEDEDGNTFTFVNVTLYGGGSAGAPSILVHTEAGQNGPSDLFWGQETAVWEAGETVTLLDADGVVQATYDIPP